MEEERRVFLARALFLFEQSKWSKSKRGVVNREISSSSKFQIINRPIRILSNLDKD